MSAQSLAAQETSRFRQARQIEGAAIDISRPTGLSFSTDSNALLVVDGAPSARGPRVAMVNLAEDVIETGNLPVTVPNLLSATYSDAANAWLLFDGNSNQLIQIKTGAGGPLDFGEAVRFDAAPLGLGNPRGMSVDPGSGKVYFLDTAGSSIVSITPAGDRGLSPDAAPREGRVYRIHLSSTPGIDRPGGISFDPQTGHLYVLSASGRKIYELGETGDLLSERDVPGAALRSPQAMVWAPSGDFSDDPSDTSLYVADLGGGGAVMELALVATVAAAGAPSTLHNTIDTSKFNPPSPDAAGITHISHAGTLLMSDSEVNEMKIFENVNLFEMTRSGALINRGVSTSFSSEPTGAAYNPSNQHVFISDDNQDKVFEITKGTDGVYGTSDDTLVSTLNTRNFNSNDPEGVTYCGGALYIVDGVNSQVYRVSGGGSNANFDTEVFGVTDPEGIGCHPNGNLFIVGDPTDTVLVTTTNGVFVGTIDISAANAVKPAGMAIAPCSAVPSNFCMYIADRGIDNGQNANENDGKVYEMSIPGDISDPGDPCGNGICDNGEDCNSCPQDCISGTSSGVACGNGVCETADGENCLTCPADCAGVQSGKPSNRFCCGDGSTGTGAVNCSDSRCGGPSACVSEPAGTPVNYCCGDAVCQGAEEPNNCAVDCGDGGGGGGCPDIGQSCQFDSDCCSLKCRGKAGAKVCKSG